MDNSASTKVDDRVLEEMMKYYEQSYAVATSEFAYRMGIESSEALENAREIIAKKIKADPKEIIFTSGSTESTNLAIKGYAKANEDKGKHIIVSEIEDFPVLKSAKRLEKRGFKISKVPVNSSGKVDIENLESLIEEDTVLISIQHANQEIGTIQDIKRIGEICKNHGIVFHTDATHTFTRVKIDVEKIPVDLITLSSHTIHGPRGVGALYIRDGVKIIKQMDGGFQEKDLRAGVENIPGIVGFAKAVELVDEKENKRIQELRDRLIHKMMETVPHTTLNGHPKDRTPQNANITFHYVEGESITLHLDMRNIAVSTGSACFSRSLEASHVIRGIGGGHERAHGSIRFSLGRYNTMDEVEKITRDIADIVKKLREISPLNEKEKMEEKT